MASQIKISVIVCTCNRDAAVADTVRSVLNNRYPEYELLVVDQSRNSRSEESLGAFRHDSRLRYFRLRETGLSLSRNFGAANARGELIAYTDDDCDVPADWLDSIARVFQQDPDTQIVFGSVRAIPHDPSLGYIPSYEVKSPVTARSVRDKIKIDGMGACMALRKSLWERLNGFDPCLGAGTRLHSAEENDFALRALIAGYPIYETPSIFVLHRGIRSRVENDALVSRYLFGSGAMLMKHLRLRQKDLPRLLAEVFWRWLFGKPLVRYGSSPMRLKRLTSFCKGCAAGMTMKINRSTSQFINR